MIKRNAVFVLSAVLLFIFSPPVAGEHVFLKDGTVIEGKVLGDTDKGVTLKEKDGSSRYIKNSGILRVVYWKFAAERSYIKLHSGLMVSGYKVDEDTDTITLRDELNVNREFAVKKKEILYITGAMPYNLSAGIDADSINLTWESSVPLIKEFEILVKKENDKEFTAAGRTASTRFVIKNAEKKTLYAIKVRSVDEKGELSPESSAVKIKTDGSVVPVPEITGYDSLYPSANNGYALNLRWETDTSDSGSVKMYRIFLKDGDVLRAAGETAENSITLRYSVSGIDPDAENVFVVRSVSESGAMSGVSNEVSPRDFNKVKLPRLRGGGGPANLADNTLRSRYGTGYGVFADLFLFRYRFRERYYFSHGFDIGTRGGFRSFKQDGKIFSSVDEPIIWGNTMKLYSLDLFLRYSAGFMFLGEHWDFYLYGAPRFMYSKITTEGKPEYAGGDRSYTYKSHGRVGGIGIECTLFKWSGLFAEYNYGVVPLDGDGRNVEGHQFYAGVMMRQ